MPASILKQSARATNLCCTRSAYACRNVAGYRRGCAGRVYRAGLRVLTLLSRGRDLHPIGERIHVGQRHAIPATDPLDDFHAVPDAIARLELARGQAIALDNERPINAVAVLHRGIWNGLDLFDQGGLEPHAGERAR